MKNTMFSIVITLLAALLVILSSGAGNLQDDPQQADFPDDEKVQRKISIITDIRFSPDGTKLAIAGLLSIRLYDAYIGKELDYLTINKYLFLPISVAYSPDGKTLASGCRLGIIHLWDTKQVYLNTHYLGIQKQFCV